MIIDKNKIKIALYKQRPIATKMKSSTEDIYQYNTFVEDFGRLYFSIPVKDMGVLPFEDKIPAQLLIRWLL